MNKTLRDLCRFNKIFVVKSKFIFKKVSVHILDISLYEKMIPPKIPYTFRTFSCMKK